MPSIHLGDHHTLRAGLLATYDIEQLDTESAVFPASSQFAPNPSGDDLPGPTPQSSSTPVTITANSGNSGLTSGIYLQDEWQLNDRLTLNYGVRYDRFDVSFDHEDQISPRANLVWQIDDATSAHIGYARYFMPPTLQYIPPSIVKAFEYTTDAPFNDQDDPQKVERDHYFDVGLSRQITSAWQVTRGFVLQAGQESARRRPVWQRGHSQQFQLHLRHGLWRGIEQHLQARTVFRLRQFFLCPNLRRAILTPSENEFPNNELAYVAANSIQLDHQGRFTGSGGVSYTFLKDTRALYRFPLWQRPARRICQSRETCRLLDGEYRRRARLAFASAPASAS